jgi:hypothetical protein
VKLALQQCQLHGETTSGLNLTLDYDSLAAMQQPL